MRAICALTAFVIVLCGGAANAAPPSALARPSVIGGWHGKYVCAQGVTSLRLGITRQPKDRIAATFRFGPLPENPAVPVGSYKMEGSFDPKTRRIQLKGIKWIDATSGYLMVDLDGRLDPKGLRLTGKVPFPGCTWFDLERDAEIVS